MRIAISGTANVGKSTLIRDFIKHINSDTLTEEIYKKTVCKMFLEHSIYKKMGKMIRKFSTCFFKESFSSIWPPTRKFHKSRNK